MSNRKKIIAALSAVGMAAFVISAFVLLVEAPAPFHDSMAATHNHAGAADASGPTFYSEMAQANARMHESMEIAPTGDVDRDFMRMMIAHHQGAIDMAVVLLKYGHDEKLRRLAQSIIVEQGQEIAYMRLQPVDEVTGWWLDAPAKAEIDRILRETITDPVGPEFMAPPVRSVAA